MTCSVGGLGGKPNGTGAGGTSASNEQGGSSGALATGGGAAKPSGSGKGGSASGSGTGGSRSSGGAGASAGAEAGTDNAGGGAPGGEPMLLAKAEYVGDIAVAGGYVYYADYDDDPSGDTRIAKTSLEGGETVDIWSDPDCTNMLPPLARDGDDLYWFAGCSASTRLMTLSTKNDTAKLVASGTSDAWPRPGSAWTPQTENRFLVVASGNAYWTVLTGPVLSLPLEGADSPTRIANTFDVSGPSALAYSGDRLFFTLTDYKLQGRGQVLSLVPGASTPAKLAEHQNIEGHSALAVDETWIYWGVDDAIRRAPREGGDMMTIVSSVSNPRSLVVDETSIYWIASDGEVWRASKAAP